MGTNGPDQRRRKEQLASQAIAAAGLGAWERAAEANRKLLEVDPRDVSALNRLGKALTELQRLDEALEAYRRALHLDPGNAIAHRQRAVLQRRQERPAGAAPKPFEPDSLLRDRAACIRAINALRSGVSPKAGLVYLSVGLQREVETIGQRLGSVASGDPASLLVEMHYGEGKSHLLGLIQEMADGAGFLTSYVVHDPLWGVSLNRPVQLYRAILDGIGEAHPDFDLSPYYADECLRSTSYAWDRLMREGLTDRLTRLAAESAKWGYAGLLVVIDELESLNRYSLPNVRSRFIAYEVMDRMLQPRTAARRCLVVGALTPSTFERFQTDIRWTYEGPIYPVAASWERSRLRFLTARTLDVDDAVALFGKIASIHACALDWRPEQYLDIGQQAQELVRRAQDQANGLHFRTFVQLSVHALEVVHQRLHHEEPRSGPVRRPVAPQHPGRPAGRPPARPIDRSVAQPAAIRRGPLLAEGMVVQITQGPMRGWIGRIESVNGSFADVLVEGARSPIRTTIAVGSLTPSKAKTSR